MSVVDSDAMSPLLERDRERAELDALFAAAAAGRGGVLVVEGPAGIGKTRLLEAWRDDITANGGEVGAARGASLEVDIPYGVVRQLLEPLIRTATDPQQLFADGAAPATSVLAGAGVARVAEVAPGTVLHGLYWLTAAMAEAASPLVLICDDAHWTDATSLRYLAYLVNRIAELPLALVIGARPPDPTSAEGDVLARLVEYPRVRRLHLAALSTDAVRTLVQRHRPGRASGPFCDAVATATSGNPFLVGELLRTVAAASPGAQDGADVVDLAALDVDAAILGRIGRLPPTAMQVARAVAVLGNDAHLRHVARLVELGVDEAGIAADQLVRTDILTVERPLRFVHPLVAAAVAGSLLPGERSLLHRRAATVLRAEAAPADRLAPHLMAIEPAADPDVVTALTDSASRAMEQGATEVAIAQWRRALDEPPPVGDRLDIVLRLAAAESLVNDPRAHGHFEQAIASIDDHKVRTLLATAEGVMLTMNGRWSDARRGFDRFVAAADADPRLSRQLIAGRAIAASVGRLPAADMASTWAAVREAVVVGDEPLSGGGELDDVPASVLGIRAFVAACTGESAAVAADLAVKALASIETDVVTLPLWFHPAVGALIMADRDDLAAAEIERGLTAARRAGSPMQVCIMHFLRAHIAFRAGELDDADEDANASLALSLELGLDATVPAAVSVLLDVCRERDRPDDGEDLLVRHGLAGDDDPIGPDAIGVFDLLLLFSRARLRGARGRWAESIADLDRGWHLAQLSGCTSPGLVAWDANRAFAQVLSGVPADAAARSRSAEASARTYGSPRAMAEAQRVLVMSRAAEPSATLGLLAEATATFRALGARLEEARTAAASSYAVGSTDIEPLTRAMWLAEEMGAPRLVTIFREELRARGASRRRYRPAHGAASLTASEGRVARLAAAGHTNKEIAQELFVSVKTVETHLARCFQKLGVGARGELRSALAS